MRWWAHHKPSYPILSSVAQTMLCVPVTSVAIERGFSKASDISRAKKNMLAPLKPDTVVFLMDNL